MRLLWLFITIPLLVSLSACSGGGGDDSNASTNQPPICLNLSLPGAKVINGAVCSGSASPIVQVRLLNNDGSEGLCTGTVIGPRRVLTAAHCYLVKNVATTFIVSNSQQFLVGDVAIHPGVGVDGENLAVFNDVAVLTTTAAMGLPSLPILTSVDAKKGNIIGIEGFGVDENGDFGTQKGGIMKISKVTSNHIFAAFQGDNSNVCNGDSGGPAYLEVNTENGEAIGLIGVVSSGNPETGCLDGDVSLFANLQNADIVSFILLAAPETGLI